MSNTPDALTVGKWVAGIAATIIAALLVWWLTRPGGVLDPKVPTAEPVTVSTPSPVTGSPPSPAPHAPPIVNDFGVELFEEQQRLVKVDSGEKVTLRGQELWSAPALTEADCLSAFIAITWIVRDPYPKGGEDLQIRAPVPQNEITEKVAEGSSGSLTMGYCSELILFNTSLTDYQVEIRFASAMQLPP